MTDQLNTVSGMIDAGAWITIPLSSGDLMTGKFSGVYDNPTLGRMFMLSFARRHSDPSNRSTMCFVFPECEDRARLAFEVDGPMKSNGNAPRRRP